MENTTEPVPPAIKDLKQAASRARHAKMQLERYPNSVACQDYVARSKRELAKAYATVGVVLAEQGLI